LFKKTIIMKNFFNKQREIVALLAYVLIVVGLVYLVIFPLIARIDDTNNQIQKESISKESVELHISQLPKIQKQYQSLQVSGDLSNVLLDENKAIILIEKLEKLAENTNNKITISVQDKTVAPAKKAASKIAAQASKSVVDDLPSTDYLQMKITLIGEYNAAVHFIDQLEKFEYYADITAIQIKKYEEAGDSMQPLSSSGMFGAIQTTTTNILVKKDNSGNNKLATSLDIVFYTN